MRINSNQQTSRINANVRIFKNRKQIRLKGYNYSLPGLYFITICSQNRKELFGQILNKKMFLNNAGEMVSGWLQKIPNKFINIQIDTTQIMPNHIHTIIHIVGAGSSRPSMVGSSRPSMVGSSRPKYGRENRAPTIKNPAIGNPTLGQIIAYFKYQITKSINSLLYGSGRPTQIRKMWQRNYYEHIIRDQMELERIRRYIIDNPKNWETDRNNPKNLKNNLE